MNRPHSRTLLLVLLLWAAPAARAQDAQFWHNHYGTKGTLLGGAVIGSVEDLSAVYYNPGYLGLKPNPGLAFGTGVFDIAYLQIEADSLFQQPIDRVTAETAPGLIAGQITFADTAENHFTYSFMGRQKFNTVIQGRSLADDHAADRLTTLYIQQDLTEYWGGVTWSRPLTDSIGIGVSLFGAHRSHRRRNEVTQDSAFADGRVAHSSIDGGWNFWNLRLLVKVGVFWHGGPWTAGATLTTPSLSLFGYGDAYGSRAVAGAGPQNDVLVDYRLDGSNTTYRTPLSLGVGAGYRYHNVRFHASLEWFGSVDQYQVLDPVPSTDPADTMTILIRDQMRSIANAGVGLEVTVSNRFSYFFSFVTDLSTVSPDFRQVLALSTWDIFHLNGGAVFEVGDFVLTGGLGLAIGGSRPIAGSTSAPGLRFFGVNRQVDVTWGRLRAMVGLTYVP